VIAILAVGPFALPLVWSNPNPKYTPIVKTIITVIVAIITVAATYYTVVAFSRVMDQMDAMLK